MSIEDTIHDLTPEAFVTMFDIALSDNSTIFRVTPKGSHTYNGEVYEELPCSLTSVGQRADGEAKRPRFTMVNPAGLFTAAVDQRLLEGGYVTRHRSLVSEVALGIGVSKKFRIARVANVNKTTITLELRSALDSGNFKFPSRSFMPPEFPYVRL